VSGFERYAIQRLVDQATAAGIEVPDVLTSAMSHALGCASWAGQRWAELHPDAEQPICCYGAIDGPEKCFCWVPVFDVEQAEPVPPSSPEDLKVRGRMCGDCAFRKDSPEREHNWSEEALFELARTGEPFFCHDGMRRPLRWHHPDGRTVEASPHDWRPPKIGKLPYRADGSPGLLCAGWTAHAVRARAES
jgi:hypothetical protein